MKFIGKYGLYIDDDFVIYGRDHITGKLYQKKRSVSSYGYEVVTSCTQPRGSVGVHRIIAEAFIPNDDPDEYDTVDHINRNKTDNRLENLRWASHTMQSLNRDIHFKWLEKFLNW